MTLEDPETGIGHNNAMTRDEWLYVILHSGEVTRIAQHLALVIYHLSDPATNSAKLSARDLEKITGWGRTAILEHLDEIDIYIRVRWGQGRAKALFELQGVIAQAIAPMRNVRVVDTRADTNPVKALADKYFPVENVRQPATTLSSGVRQTDTTADTTISVREAVTTAATRTATNPLCPPAGHLNDVCDRVVSASRPQRGDIRGVDSLSLNYPLEARARDDLEVEASVPPFQVHPDGSFSGTAFEHFTATEIAGLRATYSWLEFPAELVAADQWLATEFEKGNVPFGSQERMGRLHSYLAKRNRDAAAAVRVAQDVQRSKATLVDESCWFAEDRLMVANGFKAELLELVGGDEARLRVTLDKAAGSVPIDLKGAGLRKVVRAQFARFADWGHQDERKVQAYEKRQSKTDSATPTEAPADRWARMRAAKHAKNGGA
jgi:hypothetical protein